MDWNSCQVITNFGIYNINEIEPLHLLNGDFEGYLLFFIRDRGVISQLRSAALESQKLDESKSVVVFANSQEKELTRINESDLLLDPKLKNFADDGYIWRYNIQQ